MRPCDFSSDFNVIQSDLVYPDNWIPIKMCSDCEAVIFSLCVQSVNFRGWFTDDI